MLFLLEIAASIKMRKFVVEEFIDRFEISYIAAALRAFLTTGQISTLIV